MIITKMALPRRTFLRGIGAAIALPFLDSMVPALRAASTTTPVQRLGFFYVPNGMYLPNFHPAGEGGTSFEFTPVLKALEPFRDQVTVVSGLAMGIDAAAHRGALESGGRTVAVLGCGADRAYPRINHALYRQVREAGAVVAELPPGAPPSRWTFPARNRIMAGLASVTVVVEAAERSGSLITATFAEELGRDVGAVPGRVTSREAAGSNALLHAGAGVWRGGEDILDAVLGAGNWDRAAVERVPGEAGLDQDQRRVLRAIEDGESIGAVAEAAGLSAGALRGALGKLELIGLVRRDGLGRYERALAR